MFINTNTKHERGRKNVVFLLLLLKMCIVFSQTVTPKKVIVIDPGHGGKDTGAIGINGIQEKEVVLKVAKEILKFNRTILNDRFDIYLTRYKDTLISLSDRTRLAKALKTSVFVSLHCNHAESLIPTGTEIYVGNSDESFTKEAITLALSVLKESTQKLNFKTRGVKFANYQVLREAKSYPAVLFETGFITNTDEAEYLSSRKNIKAMALAILLGITNYLNVEL